MTFLELIRDKLPADCEVDPACGKVAELNYHAEIAGKTEEFSQEHFEQYGVMACRQRAKVLFMPYSTQKVAEYNHGLDLTEYTVAYHEIKKHGGMFEERIDFLEPLLSAEEIDKAQRDWWLN